MTSLRRETGVRSAVVADGGEVTPPDHEAWRADQSTLDATVDGHDVEIAYWEGGAESDADGGDGDGNDGPPVVLLHGIPTWSYLWRRVGPPLSEDYPVVAPDLAGYGYSSTHDGFDRSIRAQEQVVDAVLGYLDTDEAVLVGHDVGGGVALRYAAHQPDRVAGLVLSNAVCYDSWPVQFVTDLGLPGTADRDVDDVAADLEGAFSAGVHADDPDPAFVSGMVAPWRREGGPRALARAAVATNTNHTTEVDYGAIEAPLLCLWGGDDVMQPVDYAERLAADVGGGADGEGGGDDEGSGGDERGDAEGGGGDEAGGDEGGDGEGRVVALDRAYHWVVEDRPAAYREHLRSFLTETVSAGE